MVKFYVELFFGVAVGAFQEAPEKESAKINNPSVTFGASSLYTREPLAGDSWISPTDSKRKCAIQIIDHNLP